MMSKRYVRRNVFFNAERWITNADGIKFIFGKKIFPLNYYSKGFIETKCDHCNEKFENHGQIGEPFDEDFMMICPGDWIIKNATSGLLYVLEDVAFNEIYEIFNEEKKYGRKKVFKNRTN